MNEKETGTGGRKRSHSGDLLVRDVLSHAQFQNACGGKAMHFGLNKYKEWLLSTHGQESIPKKQWLAAVHNKLEGRSLPCVFKSTFKSFRSLKLIRVSSRLISKASWTLETGAIQWPASREKNEFGSSVRHKVLG